MGFLKVTQAEYVTEYCVRLWFNNGEVRFADLRESLVGPVFEPLRDVQVFMNFRIPYNTLEWENGADFAPEYLYSISQPSR